jgi:hypothetical protein
MTPAVTSSGETCAAIEPLAQVEALREAQRLLVRGMYEGIPLVSDKLSRARAYLGKEADAIAAQLLDPDSDPAKIEEGR